MLLTGHAHLRSLFQYSAPRTYSLSLRTFQLVGWRKLSLTYPLWKRLFKLYKKDSSSFC